MLAESGVGVAHPLAQGDGTPTWQSLIEHSPAATVVLDRAGCVVVWNAAAERLLGLHASAVVGRPLPGVLDCEPELIPPWFARTSAGETMSSIAWPLSGVAATPLAASVGPIRSSTGQVVGVQVVLQPVGALDRPDLLQRITDAIPGVVFQFRQHPDGSFSLPYASRGTIELWGLTPQEAMADLNRVWALVDPADFPRLLETIRQSALHLTPWLYECRIRTPGGQPRWMRGKSLPRRESDGSVLWHGVVFDVTDRKGAEDAMRRSEELLAEAQRIAGIGSWEWVVGTQTVWWSDEMYRLFGHQPGAFTPSFEGFLNSLPADERAAVAARIEGTLTGNQPYDFDHGIVLPDGTTKALHTLGHVDRDAAGRPVRLLGTCQDVTERRQAEAARLRAEAALRESESRFRVAFEYGPVGVMVGVLPSGPRSPGRIVQVNPALCQFFDCTAATLLHAPDPLALIQEQTHPEDRAKDLEQFFRILSGELDTYRLEKRYLLPDGRLRWGDLRVGVARDPLGRIEYVVSQITDITELKQAEQERRQLELQMRQTQKLESLGLMAGGIAHDFNNLLTAILGNASLALTELPPESPAAPLLREVEKAAHRAADLTQQMLAYSGKGTFHVTAVDLSALVREMAQLLHTVLSRKTQVVFEFAPGLPAIEADATQVRQIIMNLITNASEALNDQPGVVTVATGRLTLDQPALYAACGAPDLAAGPYVFLRVTDTGCGMDEATRARIFDPFFTTKFIGRGLGLASVLGIVRGHRGAIRVVSAVGRGSLFEVLFPYKPVQEMPPPLPEPTRPAAEWRGHGTILVVDDEESVRGLARRILERAGFQVLTAHDGRAGVELFERAGQKVDAVLLDLTMPRLSGLEALQELHRLRPGLPVVLMSGFSEQDIRSRCAGQEPAAFLQKPFFPEHVLAAVRQALER